MIGHHHVLFTAIYYLPGISVSLALYPHNVNKFVLIVSNFYVAKVLSQQNLLTLYPNPLPSNPKMAPTTDAVIKPTLELNSRIHYPKWCRAVQTFAVLHYKEVCRRCGLLTAVLTDAQWPLHPINRTAANDPADPDIITPRPDVALPAAHAANANNAALRIYERQLNTHDAYLAGLSTLLDALILSIGPANALLLADPVHGMMLVTCGDVMAMMQQKHGTPQASDISTLKSLLTVPLKHLHDFSAHLSAFNENLADLDFFAQPIQPYDQFTIFLQTISNHPAINSRMTMYFSTNPEIATHTIASLTTYLTEQLPHMITTTSPTHLGATMSHSSSHVGLLNTPADMSINTLCGTPHQTYLQSLHNLAATANQLPLPTSLPGRQAADPNSKRSKSKARKLAAAARANPYNPPANHYQQPQNHHANITIPMMWWSCTLASH